MLKIINRLSSYVSLVTFSAFSRIVKALHFYLKKSRSLGFLQIWRCVCESDRYILCCQFEKLGANTGLGPQGQG